MRLPCSCLLLPGPPMFASAALHGGFSSLLLSALFGMRVHRLAPLQKQASRSKPQSFFRGRLCSLPPPSMAAFLRYCSALSSGGESTTRTPEASLLLASGVPPSFAFAALHGGFSSLLLSALFGRRVYDSPPPPPCCQNTHVLEILPPCIRKKSSKIALKP